MIKEKIVHIILENHQAIKQENKWRKSTKDEDDDDNNNFKIQVNENLFSVMSNVFSKSHFRFLIKNLYCIQYKL